MKKQTQEFSHLYKQSAPPTIIELTPETALELIQHAMGFPRPITTLYANLKKPDPLRRETERLVREGYIDCRKIDYLYLVNECGGTFESVFWVSFITFKQEIRRIVEILTDESTGTATVTYEVGVTETPFMKRLIEIDPARLIYLEPYMKQRFGTQPQQNRVSLKKWDQGWRIN